MQYFGVALSFFTMFQLEINIFSIMPLTFSVLFAKINSGLRSRWYTLFQYMNKRHLNFRKVLKT